MSRKWTIHDVERIRDAGLGVNIGTAASHPSVRFVIGVDPGKNTGIAIWDRQTKVFTQVSCMLIHQAFELVKKMAGGMNVLVRVEDARQRTWFGNTGREKLQGAGAAKREYGRVKPDHEEVAWHKRYIAFIRSLSSGGGGGAKPSDTRPTCEKCGSMIGGPEPRDGVVLCRGCYR